MTPQNETFWLSENLVDKKIEQVSFFSDIIVFRFPYLVAYGWEGEDGTDGTEDQHQGEDRVRLRLIGAEHQVYNK